MEKLTLFDLLDDVSVVERDPGYKPHATWPEDFPYAVSDGEGFLALFPNEAAAFHYRLMVINQRLNSDWQPQLTTSE